MISRSGSKTELADQHARARLELARPRQFLHDEVAIAHILHRRRALRLGRCRLPHATLRHAPCTRPTVSSGSLRTSPLPVACAATATPSTESYLTSTPPYDDP